MAGAHLEDDGDDREEVDDSKTSRELAALRAAVARLAGMVNELALRRQGEETG